jgi:hypothetical protein
MKFNPAKARGTVLQQPHGITNQTAAAAIRAPR